MGDLARANEVVDGTHHQAAQPGGRGLPSDFFPFCFVSMPPGQAPGLWTAAWGGDRARITMVEHLENSDGDRDEWRLFHQTLAREGETLDDLLHAECLQKCVPECSVTTAGLYVSRVPYLCSHHQGGKNPQIGGADGGGGR